MKNKVFTIFFTMLLSMFVCVQAADTIQEFEQPAFEEIKEPTNALDTLDEQTVQKKDDIKTDVSTIPHKEPLQKRKLAKLFIKAMIAVALSSLILYAGLTIYNKIRNGNTVTYPVQNSSETSTSLSKPTTIEEAVKAFLDKTNWK